MLIGYFMFTENLKDVFNYTISGQKVSYLEMLPIILVFNSSLLPLTQENKVLADWENMSAIHSVQPISSSAHTDRLIEIV